MEGWNVESELISSIYCCTFASYYFLSFSLTDLIIRSRKGMSSSILGARVIYGWKEHSWRSLGVGKAKSAKVQQQHLSISPSLLLALVPLLCVLVELIELIIIYLRLLLLAELYEILTDWVDYGVKGASNDLLILTIALLNVLLLLALLA